MFLYLICCKKCLIGQWNVRNYKIIFVNLIADINMTYDICKQINLPNVSVTVEYSCKIYFSTLIYFYICES